MICKFLKRFIFYSFILFLSSLSLASDDILAFIAHPWLGRDHFALTPQGQTWQGREEDCIGTRSHPIP